MEQVEAGIEISGFGKFGSRFEVARVERNPMTSEEAEIFEKMVFTFKSSWLLVEAVDEY